MDRKTNDRRKYEKDVTEREKDKLRVGSQRGMQVFVRPL